MESWVVVIDFFSAVPSEGTLPTSGVSFHSELVEEDDMGISVFIIILFYRCVYYKYF